MTTRRTHLVKEVARLSGVSVRTLHHYDEIGLLVPSARTEAGYRLYDDRDLLRLQQILIGRTQGLSLEEIRRGLDDPKLDRRAALLEQRAHLAERVKETQAMIRAVDSALAALEAGGRGGQMDITEIFEGFNPAEHEEEAEQRWGHTEAYRASARRTKSYTPADWERINAAPRGISADAAGARAHGPRPDAPEVMNIAERHRRSIDRWFYPCEPGMHAGLADLWEGDERFRANIDRGGEGLATFLAAAVRANAARQHRGPVQP